MTKREVDKLFKGSYHEVLDVYKDSGYTFVKHGRNEDNNRLDMFKTNSDLEKNIKELVKRFSY